MLQLLGFFHLFCPALHEEERGSCPRQEESLSHAVKTRTDTAAHTN